jgi:mgtE-like transporter
VRWTEKIRTPDRTGRRASRASLTPEDRERIREERRKRRIERTRLVARVPARAAEATARGVEATARGVARGATGVARVPVIVVRYPALALIDVWRYWRAERTTLRQGMAALSISALGNLPTGLALGFMTGRLKLLPGLFILIPAAIGMRGNIFGALGSRLGTSIHAGLFQVSMDKRGVLYQNVYAATLLTFMTSLFLAVAARVVSSATGLASISIWDFVVISVLGGVFSSAFILVLTVALAREGYRRDWDLDAVAAPLITFMGDLITLPALFAASYVAARGKVTLVLGIACALVCGYAFVMAVQTKLPTAKRILVESAVVLALAGSIDMIAGTVVEHRLDRFIALPALLIMLPAFLENAGALGGIVASRLASRLHLGAIRPRLLPERLAALDISLAGPWAVLNFGLTGVTAHFIAVATNKASPGLLLMVGIALLAGAFSTVGAALLAYGTAVATFRFGLDPDNHGIPMITSSMDLAGVLAVVGVVVLLGVR